MTYRLYKERFHFICSLRLIPQISHFLHFTFIFINVAYNAYIAKYLIVCVALIWRNVNRKPAISVGKFIPVLRMILLCLSLIQNTKQLFSKMQVFRVKFWQPIF